MVVQVEAFCGLLPNLYRRQTHRLTMLSQCVPSGQPRAICGMVEWMAALANCAGAAADETAAAMTSGARK